MPSLTLFTKKLDVFPFANPANQRLFRAQLQTVDRFSEIFWDFAFRNADCRARFRPLSVLFVCNGIYHSFFNHLFLKS